MRTDSAGADTDRCSPAVTEIEYGIGAVAFALGWTDVCGKTVEELARETRQERNRLRSELDQARGMVEKMARALLPFAEVYNGGEGYEGYTADECISLKCGRVSDFTLRLGNLRDAALTVASTNGK